MRLLTFLIFLVSLKCFSYDTLLSGSAQLYAESKKFIALRSYGVRYSRKTHSLKEFSTLEIRTIKDNKDRHITVTDVPKFVGLRWTENSEYLIGVSNIVQEGNPNIVIINNRGKVVNTHTFDCGEKEEESWEFYCVANPEYLWVQWQLNSFHLELFEQSINVCIGNFCNSVAIASGITD